MGATIVALGFHEQMPNRARAFQTLLRKSRSSSRLTLAEKICARKVVIWGICFIANFLKSEPNGCISR